MLAVGRLVRIVKTIGDKVISKSEILQHVQLSWIWEYRKCPLFSSP